MTLSKSECAKLGSQKSREVSAEIKRRNIINYLKNPKLCKKCNNIIIYEKRRNDYCSMSCAASVRNKGIIRHKNPDTKAKRLLYLKSDAYKKIKCESQNKRKKSKRNLLLSVFGCSCILCNYKSRLTIHRKDGSNHKDFNEMSWKDIENVIINDKDKYVTLCYKCHKSVHWCMKFLNMPWNEIYDKSQHLLN